jgi:hypothetical protein
MKQWIYATYEVDDKRGKTEEGASRERWRDEVERIALASGDSRHNSAIAR